jgi:hypothetical protein
MEIAISMKIGLPYYFQRRAGLSELFGVGGCFDKVGGCWEGAT